MIASRVRQSLGTLTRTTLLRARMTMPYFVQYDQPAVALVTAVYRRAGGAETMPSTGRAPSVVADLELPITFSQPTVSAGSAVAA